MQYFKVLVAVAGMMCGLLAAKKPLHSDSGLVKAVKKVSHDGYIHTVVSFEITSSVSPVLTSIWLYNDEERLKVNDHVRLGWELYGTDSGEQEVTRCLQTALLGLEPCMLQRLVSVDHLKDGEY